MLGLRLRLSSNHGLPRTPGSRGPVGVELSTVYESRWFRPRVGPFTIPVGAEFFLNDEWLPPGSYLWDGGDVLPADELEFLATTESGLIDTIGLSIKNIGSESGSLQWMGLRNLFGPYAFFAQAPAGSMFVNSDGSMLLASDFYGSKGWDGNKISGTDKTIYINGRINFKGSDGVYYSSHYDTTAKRGWIVECSNGYSFAKIQEYYNSTFEKDVGESISVVSWNFTEDKNGNIWTGEYGLGTPLELSSAVLWRKRNGTWENVIVFDGANGTIKERHVHWVYYCPHQDKLYVALGDNDNGILYLPGSKLDQEVITSSDFVRFRPYNTSWPLATGKMCVVPITSDANYRYASLDIHVDGANNRAILRWADDDANISEVVYEESYTTGAYGVLAWWAHSYNGVVVFSYAVEGTTGENKIVFSGDQGETWTERITSNKTNAAGGLRSAFLPSYYDTTWAGIYAGGAACVADDRPVVGRIGTGRISISPTGFDYSLGSEGYPLKNHDFLPALLSDNKNVRFNGEFTQPVAVNLSGCKLSGGKFSGTAVGVAAGLSETFEALQASWTFTSTAGASAESTIVASGSQSAKILTADGTSNPKIYKYYYFCDSGDVSHIKFKYYLAANVVANGRFKMAQINGSSTSRYEIYVRGAGASFIQNELTLAETSRAALWMQSGYTVPDLPGVVISAEEWHDIELIIGGHVDEGYFKILVDGKLAAHVVGQTLATAAERFSYFSLEAYGSANSFYVDEFQSWKNTEPADLGSLNIAGSGNLVSAITASVNPVINNATTTRFASMLLRDMTGDAFETTGDTSVKNSIFTNITGNDIVDNGATVTVAGNFTDGDGDPLIDPAGRLTATSICIGAGINPFVQADGDQYDADGYKIYAATLGIPEGQWIDGVDIGAYAYGGGDKVYLPLTVISGTGPSDWVVKLPAAPDIINILGLDSIYYDASAVPKEITWATHTDNGLIRFGSKGAVCYAVMQDAAAIVKIDRYIGN